MNPSFCNNKFCSQEPANYPASGVTPAIATCGSYKTMLKDRKEFGGFTGRGVTPCNFGYYEQNSSVQPWNGENLSVLFFEPNKPGYLPPQGDPRPLTRIGYTYRN